MCNRFSHHSDGSKVNRSHLYGSDQNVYRLVSGNNNVEICRVRNIAHNQHQEGWPECCQKKVGGKGKGQSKWKQTQEPTQTSASSSEECLCAVCKKTIQKQYKAPLDPV